MLEFIFRAVSAIGLIVLYLYCMEDINSLETGVFEWNILTVLNTVVIGICASLIIICA